MTHEKGTHVMKNEIVAKKIKKNVTGLKVAHSFFKKNGHWERREMLLKAIPKKEHGTDAFG